MKCIAWQRRSTAFFRRQDALRDARIDSHALALRMQHELARQELEARVQAARAQMFESFAASRAKLVEETA